MSEISNLKKEIQEIKARNRRVEKDKEWETSWFRRISISVVTYILITIFLIIIEVKNPFAASIVPAAAFLISTATLGFLKNLWLKNRK